MCYFDVTCTNFQIRWKFKSEMENSLLARKWSRRQKHTHSRRAAHKYIYFLRARTPIHNTAQIWLLPRKMIDCVRSHKKYTVKYGTRAMWVRYCLRLFACSVHCEKSTSDQNLPKSPFWSQWKEFFFWNFFLMFW